VKFIEVAPGDVVIEQGFPVGMKPLLDAAAAAKPLAEIFRSIEPAAPVPAELLDADVRVDELQASGPQPFVGTPPPSEPRPEEVGANFYTAGENQNWAGTYCRNWDAGSSGQRIVLDCEFKSSSIVGPWNPVSSFEVDGLVGSEYTCGSSSCPVTFTLAQWVCDSKGNNCGEKSIYSTSMFAGWNWVWQRNTGGAPQFFRGRMTGASFPTNVFSFAENALSGIFSN
jgi:hypothetical protein